MAAASNRHYLNDLDLFDTYGVFVRAGLADFVALPERKASLEHSWPEVNGTEIDLDRPVFEDKAVNLLCGMLLASRNEFHSKRLAFIQAIAAPGWQRWRTVDQAAEYSIRYVSTSSWEFLSGRLNNPPQVVVLFELQLVASNDIQINYDILPLALPVTVKDALGNVLLSAPSGSQLTIASDFTFGLNLSVI